MSEPEPPVERTDESPNARRKWRYFSLALLLVGLAALSRFADLRARPRETKEPAKSASAARCPAETIEDEGLCVPLTRLR